MEKMVCELNLEKCIGFFLFFKVMVGRDNMKGKKSKNILGVVLSMKTPNI